ncbi:porin [Acinetobacter sp. ANC 4558]|uniref:OprD family outer membrane porin n=1 Tax=Acinetobacter sp. ANC 4558 TaxID=1977876 RepID=UPI000A352985|nr:OprD family outer membrane porin [Acinetobacter sp. ANC 4558]OTG86135.1 porin [Acinetobacter sp. ANC 4558]
MNIIKGVLLPLCLINSTVFASDFFKDANGSLTARNYYLDREFTDFKAIPGAKDWAQGFILNLNSGYTEGPVGFGLDIIAMSSIKLHGSDKYLSTGLLPTDPITRQRTKTASEIGATGKIKYQKSELKFGTVQPWNPIVFSSPTRLLPQTYRGVLFDSKDIEKFDFIAGYIDQVNHRDSTNYEDMAIVGANGRFKVSKTDSLSYIGTKYSYSPATQVGLYHGIIRDIYHQSAFTFKNNYKVAEDTKLLTDLRFWHSKDDGKSTSGRIDNTLLTGNLGVGYKNHTLTFSTMQNIGDTAHPYLTGGEVLLFIDGWSVDFLNPKEKVYGLRYDYDFKDYLPGLRFMTRYTKGIDINLPHLGGNNLKEDSLDFDIQYILQTGQLKGLSLRARHMISDNNFHQSASFKPAKETRINIDYTWKF